MTQSRPMLELAREVLKASDAERIAFLRQDRWIGYKAAHDVLTEMQRLYEHPAVVRPPNLLLTADTNNGKTTIVKRFASLHPVVDDPHAARAERSVVILDAPATPDEDRFYNHLLRSLGAVFKITDKADKKLFQVTDLLLKTGLRVLVLDEVNNTLAGTGTRRQQMLNAIKELGSHLQRPVILTGTFEALAALRDDKQVQNRFPPRVLPRWQLDEEFLTLLVSFETTLPLRRASNLASEQLAPLLLVMCGGVIGELSTLLKRASERAILSGRERITRSLLLELDWLPPAERDQAASAAEAGLTHRLDYQAQLNRLTAGLTADQDDQVLEAELD